MTIGWHDAPGDYGVYQSRAYGEAAAASADMTWDVIGDEAGLWRLPVCISGPSQGFRDATSPYGYPGIHASAKLSGAQVAQAWNDTRHLLEDRGIVSLFVRFTPYREQREDWHHHLEGLETIRLSETIVVPTAEDASMWGRMHGRSRTAVRKAENSGLTAHVDPADQQLTDPDAPFRRLYRMTMDRVAAGTVHRHADHYFRRLVEGLGTGLQIVTVKDSEGSVVAACLLLIDDDGVHYHLSGSGIEAARLGANNLMVWTALRWANAESHPMVHLGGGTRRGDSLYMFKASFGGSPAPFVVGRLVVLSDTYGRLTRERAQLLGVPADDLVQSDFFPAYRGGARS